MADDKIAMREARQTFYRQIIDRPWMCRSRNQNDAQLQSVLTQRQPETRLRKSEATEMGFSRLRISVFFSCLMAASSAAVATQLPVRKAGHWQLTTVAATVGMKTFDACITRNDPIVTGIGKKNCTASGVRVLGDERYVDVVCTTGAGKETTSTVLTGNFSTWYRAMSKITFDPPQDGVAHMGVTIDGKYLGPDCPSNMSTGNVR
ncbi:DUF3617 domain-containing protein [Hyphomicrobium sp. MC8b]|uniref:DUF3617 domain-containing protein n=1 Tax=Hyphomicrobium sp. MC8b TaxID=300273 RepID=UPI00391DE777